MRVGPKRAAVETRIALRDDRRDTKRADAVHDEKFFAACVRTARDDHRSALALRREQELVLGAIVIALIDSKRRHQNRRRRVHVRTGGK
jgi:hypothetical protein